MKFTTAKERKDAYLKLAKWLYENMSGARSDKGGICLHLRMIYFDVPLDFNFSSPFNSWIYDEVGKYFPEYGMINPLCSSHYNDNERITALLFAAELCDDKNFVPLSSEEINKIRKK